MKKNYSKKKEIKIKDFETKFYQHYQKEKWKNNLIESINSNYNSDVLVKLRKDLDKWVIETNDLGKFPEIELIPKKYLK